MGRSITLVIGSTGKTGRRIAERLEDRGLSVRDGVQQALGRPPRDFTAYARHTALSGVWGGER